MRAILAVGLLMGIAGGTSRAAATDGNRLTYLDESDPYYVGRNFPRLTTPQWVGEEGVEAVVVLAIDDMRGHERWEEYLRPILERLKAFDGRAPVSIMTCSIDPADPHLQTWLAEGLNLDVHTVDHPCPILKDGDLAKAKSTYDRCVDLLAGVPENRPVAFRTPCCDSLNTVSPRFFAEIFNRTTPEGRFLAIDSSVFNVITPNDPELPRELVLEDDGRARFGKYLPADRTFVNTIEDYPYPYVIGRLCWEFPCVTPSDWSAQHFHQPNNPQTVADLKAALDAVVLKRGVYNLVFHPHGWIRNDQIIELIDHAVSNHGKKVKFLNFREALARLETNVLGGHSLRAADGQDNGVRLLDLNADGFLDAAIGNDESWQTRVWSPETGAWTEGDFPGRIVEMAEDGRRRDAGARFGILRADGHASALIANGTGRGVWSFDGSGWMEEPEFVQGLEVDGHAILTSLDGRDRGIRLRDIDGDGRCECLVANDQQQAIFAWHQESDSWHRLPFTLPPGTLLADAAGRDRGLRLVDINEDGRDDVLFSNEERFSLHLFESIETGWSSLVTEGRRGDEGAIPMIVRGETNNGAWFHSRHLWVQNEDTAGLADLVDRRSFNELLADVEPGPLSPEASLRSMRARPGFQVELVAAEPLVKDPIAFAWGPDARLWVVEMADYPLGVDGQGKFGGRVRYLEDADGDGRYDRSTLFLDDLGYPTGVMPWRNGVLVTCAPEIFYAEDTDGDGRADRRETLYEGFGEGNQQHRVNGLVWGLDNWVYCANGDSGGTICSLGTGDEVEIGGRDFRIRPDEGLIDPQTGQTQFGRGQDDWGNWFGCNNSNPMFHFALADHYLRRNPNYAGPDPRVHVSLTPGAAEVFPVSRTLSRFNDPARANRFTSACSVIIYRDELFGPAFAGNSFVSEPVHNLVHREVISPQGCTFTSRRASDEASREFLASSDNWFRPTMIQTGPDGALWIADMYRHVIEHPEWIPKDVQDRLDLRAGHDKGRIYRVFSVGKPPRPIARLDRLDTPGLVAALNSPNGWQRDMAQQLLVQRQDTAAVPLLTRLASHGDRPLARLHALCTLDGLIALSLDVLRQGLRDPHPGVRRHAIRLCEAHLAAGGELAEDLVKLTSDPDPHVTLQLAYTIGGWPDPRGGEALGRLALDRGDDPYLLAAVMSSLRDENIAEVVRAVLSAAADKPPADDLVAALLGQAAALENEAALVAALETIARPDNGAQFKYAPWKLSALAGLLDALDRRGSSLAQLHERADMPLRTALDLLARLFATARTMAVDEEASESHRALALSLLGRGLDQRQEDIELLSGLLAPRTPGNVQAAVVGCLGRLGDPRVPEILLAGWRGHGPQVRSQAIDVLAGRDQWLAELLDAIRTGRVPPSEIDLIRRRQFLEHPQSALRERAADLLAGTVNSDRLNVLEAYQSALSLRGDLAAGAAVFKKSCAACHRLAEVGHAIGPDLAALADRSPSALMTAILDPSRAVEARFLNYTAQTLDGRTFTGMLVSESGNSITLVAQEAKEQVLLRSEIEILESAGKSMMPEGVEKDVPVQSMSDLLAYLGAQGPPRKEFPDSRPEVVRPREDGSLRLLATNCEIYGPTLVLEDQYQNLGYWQSEADQAVWTVEVPGPRRYEVQFDFACDDAAAGNSWVLAAGEARLAGNVQGTGSWNSYLRKSNGQIELPAGPVRLVLRSDGPVAGAMIDLREIRLIPKDGN